MGIILYCHEYVCISLGRAGRAFESSILALRQHLDLHPMDIAEMQAQHGQLNSPSIPTRMGESLLALYHAEGFKAVQKAIDRRNRLLLIPSIMKRIMRKLIGRH